MKETVTTLLSKIWTKAEPPDIPTRAQQLWYVALAGVVTRHHVTPTVTVDTVGEHTFGVAVLCYFLLEPRNITVDLLVAALFHDVPELTVGDVPSPTKRRIEATSTAFQEMESLVLRRMFLPEIALSENESRTLKLADIADGLLHCCYERSLGNLNICAVYENYTTYANEFKPFTPRESEVLNAISEIWEAYNGSH